MTTAETVEELSGLDSTQVEQLQMLTARDLFAFSKGVLRYPDINKETHGRYCRFIQSSPKKRRLGLMPRAHLKSTIATIADGARLPILDPINSRTLIVGETATNAQKFMAEIKNHWQNNAVLRGLFPDLAPKKFSGPGVTWAADMSTLPVEGRIHREAHWTAIGVGGAITGGHFTRIKCDDLIGIDAARSATKMQNTIDWVNNIEPLLVDQHEDIIDFTGTRWSRHDLYAHLMYGYGEELGVFVREAVEDGMIIFPALHTWEEYERLQRISPNVWFAQYCNNPVAAGQADFPVDSVGTFSFTADGQAVVARNYGQELRYHLSQLYIVITVDPNSGSATAPDEAAIVVSAQSPNGEIFVLATWSGRPTPSEFVDEIFKFAWRWRPRVIGIEKAGQQSSAHYFEKKAREQDFFVRVEPLLPRNRDKEQRIRDNLEPIIRSSQLFLLASQQELRNQIAQFPDTLLFDLVDALAYGPEVWKKPHDVETVEERTKNYRLLMGTRNRRTGY